jgi:hypothetical protein
MQTETSHKHARAAASKRSFFESLWKNDDDDDQDGPKGPPSAVATFFLPLLRGSAMPAVA